jgi:hypothetical protein
MMCCMPNITFWSQSFITNHSEYYIPIHDDEGDDDNDDLSKRVTSLKIF